MATDQRPRSLADIAQGRSRDDVAGDIAEARKPGAIGWGAYPAAVSGGGQVMSRHKGASKLHTLKAYKAWAAKVRANWDAESGS
ncbi:MAG: hypothetical protein WBN65_06910 [Gammaproteobacteria bacterium]